MRKIALMSIVMLACLIVNQAYGASQHFEGFEADTWPDQAIGRTWEEYNGSTVTRVASGENGVVSSSGSYHAEISKVGSYGAFSYLGGNESSFGGGWTSSVDIYVDLSAPDGFEISQAINDNTGTHAQDNIFHVNKYLNGSGYDVGISHNSNYTSGTSGLVVEENAITDNGWYTFRWSIMPSSSSPDGVEAAWTVLDSDGNTFWEYTKDEGLGYDLSNVGGHRYMWFTYTGTTGTDEGPSFLAIDNASVSTVPEPLTMLAVGSAVAGLGGYIRRRRRG